MKLRGYMIIGVLIGGVFINNSTQAKDIGIFINENEVFMDVVPIVDNNITFVPLSFVSKQLGAIVSWENPKVILQTSRGWIECEVETNRATKNGKEIELIAAPRLINGRVFVPLRFVSDVLEAKVEYLSTEKEVHITKLKNYRVEGFHDSVSNKCLCNVYSESGAEKIATLVHDETKNTWEKFDPNFEPVWGVQKSRLQRAYPSELQLPKYNEDYGSIDLVNNLWINDFEYQLSRNEMYGVTSRIQYRVVNDVPEKYEGIFVKSFVTGEIREIHRSYIGSTGSWVNEINLKIPINDEAFDYFIYDVITGENRYITYEESKSLIPQADRQRWIAPHSIPEELDLTHLPTIQLKKTQKFEARMKINGKTYDVPFAFEKGTDSYVPLKYVIQAVGGMVEQDCIYKLNNQIIELTNDNCARYNQQFYVSKHLLQALGIELEVEYLK